MKNRELLLNRKNNSEMSIRHVDVNMDEQDHEFYDLSNKVLNLIFFKNTVSQFKL